MDVDFKISNEFIECVYNNECIICFDDIQYLQKENRGKNFFKDVFSKFKYEKENFLLHPKTYLNIKTTNITLCCGHIFHSECFLQYIIHKLYRTDFKFIAKSDDIICPICRNSFKCSTIHKIFQEYKRMLSRDIIEIINKINKSSSWLKYQKVVFSMRRVLRKEIYIGEIYSYYKVKRILNYLKIVKRELQKKKCIIKLTKVTLF